MTPGSGPGSASPMPTTFAAEILDCGLQGSSGFRAQTSGLLIDLLKST